MIRAKGRDSAHKPALLLMVFAATLSACDMTPEPAIHTSRVYRATDRNSPVRNPHPSYVVQFSAIVGRGGSDLARA